MTFQEALSEKIELAKSVSSKIYRVCPSPKSDSEGYKRYIVDIRELNLTDEDAKRYTSTNDFYVFEGRKEALRHIKI
ncbi:hypothetical protein G1K66_12285 [Tenacibaculum finnmarkense]|uniref:hypothetical protein n=1 Tax=Tenacibaculum finnmarkense TaxID=2781243 RepID=UPI001E597AD7|nr:hypothetical protein [Tenacibaculum finnmarkense]MCD8401370.1 hypothetical protein [Tenacibaculum finnmarkense genomovar ulcerans]MCG8786446.1 hypothetical protein [Tenacibaculum finnmarkense]MCG8814034.1 hypothetical protein [Tenacibaculum finnmarkense]